MGRGGGITGQDMDTLRTNRPWHACRDSQFGTYQHLDKYGATNALDKVSQRDYSSGTALPIGKQGLKSEIPHVVGFELKTPALRRNCLTRPAKVGVYSVVTLIPKLRLGY